MIFSVSPPVRESIGWRGLARLLACTVIAICTTVPLRAATPTSTLYKCTTSAGALIFSDRPCASDVEVAGGQQTEIQGQSAVRQELLPMRGATGRRSDLPSAAKLTEQCASPIGRPFALDAALEAVSGRQREALKSVVTGIAYGRSRPDFRAIAVHLDASGTLSLCMPPRATADGQKARSSYWVESNGRIIELRPSGEVRSMNDANDAVTLAGRCSETVNACVEPGKPGHSLDACFAAATTCPGGALDPAAACCPQACKDAYRHERSAGTDPISASLRVLYGDGQNVPTCLVREGLR